MTQSSSLALVEKPEYRISLVPQQDCMLLWNKVRPLLKPAVDRMNEDRWTTEHLLVELTSGLQQLWIVFNDDNEITTAATTHVSVYPNNKFLTIRFLGGEGYDIWFYEGMDILKSFAKDIGCAGVEVYGREGFWKKMKDVGFNKNAVMYSCVFEEDK